MYFWESPLTICCMWLCLQGTLIRVYDTGTQAQLLELRRGAASANIFWQVQVVDIVLMECWRNVHVHSIPLPHTLFQIRVAPCYYDYIHVISFMYIVDSSLVNAQYVCILLTSHMLHLYKVHVHVHAVCFTVLSKVTMLTSWMPCACLWLVFGISGAIHVCDTLLSISWQLAVCWPLLTLPLAIYSSVLRTVTATICSVPNHSSIDIGEVHVPVGLRYTYLYVMFFLQHQLQPGLLLTVCVQWPWHSACVCQWRPG